MGDKPSLSGTVRDAVRKFQRETGIRTVIVFGSHARGAAGPHSDVDLLLVDDRFRGKPFFARPVGLRKAWPAEIPVDLLCYSPEEFEELKRRPTLVRMAVEEGVTVTA